MKLSRYNIVVMGALLTLVGCTDDSSVPMPPDNTKPVGQQVFMDVDIRSVVDSRANEFVDGSAEEHAVSSARFLFFDEQGRYYGAAAKWTEVPGTEPDNVEYMGRSTVVLDNVGSNKYPTYLLTVLNAPTFAAKATLEETAKTLMDLTKTINDETRFVMSTTSFRGLPELDPEHYGDEKYYYATRLQPGDFKQTPDDATARPVRVYVERLAAKVVLSMTCKPNDAGVFPLRDVVTGSPGETVGASKGEAQVGVKIIGWGFVDAKSKTYLSKQLDDAWYADEDVPFAGWTEPRRYRCHWAKSVDYGVDGNAALNAKTYDGLTKEFTGEKITLYTNEYTNERRKVTKTTIASGTTVRVANTPHILIKAKLTDHAGNNLNAVLCNGYLYTHDRYKRHIISSIDDGSGVLNVYHYSSGSGYYQLHPINHYKFWLAKDAAGFHPAYKKVVEDYNLAGTGKVMLVPYLTPGATLYTKTPEGKFEVITEEQAKDILCPQLAAAQTQQAEIFNGGSMYYAITIDHNPDFDDSQDGKYGIVRNNWYEITITDVVKIGHGVFDGHHEILIPDVPSDDKFFLAVKMNVRDWYLVDNVIDL